MISVQEAREKIAAFHSSAEIKQVKLPESPGYVLAQNIHAPIALPFFIQSSVDGYALKFSDQTTSQYELLKGESSAGKPSDKTLLPGQALRVFTGAALPAGTDAVVMQEKVHVKDNSLLIDGPLPENGMNMRQPGSDLPLHELALKKGTRLNPPQIGLLAALGIEEISIYKAPAISMLITGNEFTPAGEPLKEGFIYESNSYMLQACLRQLGVQDVKTEVVKDDPSSMLEALQKALIVSDIVLITGGVSVGDYDYTVQTAEKTGVKQVFHKISQRPGKPIYFGMKDNIFVFGLPGNMSSVLTCFYIYIAPLIASLMQIENPIIRTEAKLAEDAKSSKGLTSFLKGFYKDGIVTPLPGQESYKLKSFADANCLIEIPEDTTHQVAGTNTTIYILPEF
jgi:molybdopterin molybdotransferase